jgi:hypothetical protein
MDARRQPLRLGPVRFLGTFLAKPTAVPTHVVAYVAQPLGMGDPTCLTQYRTRERWRDPRAWLSAERPRVLFELTTARLVEQKVLLPGGTVLARLVARVRDRAARRLWHRLAQLPRPDQQPRRAAVRQVPERERASLLDRLRQAPTRVSGPG